jgi:hypothetical protein
MNLPERAILEKALEFNTGRSGYNEWPVPAGSAASLEARKSCRKLATGAGPYAPR